MFKFVVLCVFAAALAEPEPQYFAQPFAQPLAYSAAYYPGSTSISQSSSSVIHPSPYAYSAPAYTHFIKKRSAEAQPEPVPEPEAQPEPEAKPEPGLSYISPYSYPYYSYPYVKSTPLISTSVYNAPLVTPFANYPYSHFIKKRSAPYYPFGYPYYAPSTYIASSPVIATKTPLYPAVDFPVAHYTAAHLIKKRSASLLPTAYVAPSTYVAPAVPASSFYSNIAYPGYYNYNYNYPSYPIAAAATHFIKKRSAPLFPAATYIAPTTYAASTPLVTPTYAANPFYSTPYYANPYLYSTYIKK